MYYPPTDEAFGSCNYTDDIHGGCSSHYSGVTLCHANRYNFLFYDEVNVKSIIALFAGFYILRKLFVESAIWKHAGSRK
jgi:hypothetical protein